MTQIVALSSYQLTILRALHRRGAVPRSEFDDDALELLYKHDFIRDQHPGKLVLTNKGLDHLLPPATHLPGEKSPSGAAENLIGIEREVAATTPASPAASNVQQADAQGERKHNPFGMSANGELRPKSIEALRAIAAAGGELDTGSIHHKSIDKLLVEQFIERTSADTVAITPEGIQWLEQHPVETTQEPPPPPAPPPPVNVAEPVANVAITPVASHTHTHIAEAVERHDGSLLCNDPSCRASQILQLLMARSPAVRDAFDYFVGLDASLERLSGV